MCCGHCITSKQTKQYHPSGQSCCQASILLRPYFLPVCLLLLSLFAYIMLVWFLWLMARKYVSLGYWWKCYFLIFIFPLLFMTGSAVTPFRKWLLSFTHVNGKAAHFSLNGIKTLGKRGEMENFIWWQPVCFLCLSFCQFVCLQIHNLYVFVFLVRLQYVTSCYVYVLMTFLASQIH